MDRAACCRFCCLLFCLMSCLVFVGASTPVATAQVLPPRQVDHLTITNDELAGEFERLAAFREAEGMRTAVVSVAWIEASVEAGLDLQTTIRSFIRAAHDEWGVRFVLLGGGPSVVPVRYARSTYYPFGGHTDIPADLYYAALDGDWDANGNGLYGEPFINAGNPGDDADLEPDVSLGRAPVETVAEAARFVDGTLATEARANEILADMLLMASVVFPTNWQPGDPISLNGAMYTHQIATFVEASPVGASTLRLYQHAGDLPYDGPLDLASALAALNGGGHGVVYFAGLASSTSLRIATENLGFYHAGIMQNAPNYHIMIGMYNEVARFDIPCLATVFMTSPNGGAAAFVGSSVAAFPQATHRLNLVFVEEVYGATPIRIGEAVDHMRTRYLDETHNNTVTRWTVLSQVLLGDPALRLGPVPPYGGTVAAPPTAVATRLLPAAPNPFNPTTTLAYELAQAGPVRLEVYGVDGRRVATLISGERSAGRHEAIWRGTDDAGRAVSSGVYLARLRHAGGVDTQRLVLVR